MRWLMTRAETILWTRLQRGRLSGFHFRKQHPIGSHIADSACASSRMLVEVDGETHWREDEQRRDARGTAFLESEGWAILRVWNEDVYRNEHGVVETILVWASDVLERAGAELRGRRKLRAKLRHAHLSKAERAAPVSTFYAKARVRRARVLKELEDEMCSFGVADDEGRRMRSPDRVDALVWAVEELTAKRVRPRAEWL